MAKAVDVVCQMNLDITENTPYVDYQDQRYYFCCTGCAKAFEQNPDPFIKP